MIEAGQRKSEYYLPESDQPMVIQPSEILLHLMSRTTIPGTDFRLSRVKMLWEGKEHFVYHIHLLNWPDRGWFLCLFCQRLHNF